MPAGIAGFSPGLDPALRRSLSTKDGIDPFFTTDGMGHTGEMYLDGQDPNQPLLAPAVLADLTGFPPILLQVGTNELLLDDSVRLAPRARDADVDVILGITAGYRTCPSASARWMSCCPIARRSALRPNASVLTDRA